MQIFLLFFQYCTNFRSVACTFPLAKVRKIFGICKFIFDFCGILLLTFVVARTISKTSAK